MTTDVLIEHTFTNINQLVLTHCTAPTGTASVRAGGLPAEGRSNTGIAEALRVIQSAVPLGH